MSGDMSIEFVIDILRNFETVLAVKPVYEKPIAAVWSEGAYNIARPMKRVVITGPMVASAVSNFRDSCLGPFNRLRAKIEKTKNALPVSVDKYLYEEMLALLDSALAESNRAKFKSEVAK